MYAVLATALLIASSLVSQPSPLPAQSATAPTQRAGYPKLYRCASPVARPEPRAGYSAPCLAWRTAELRKLEEMSTADRIERVAELRTSMGLRDDEGLTVDTDGELVAAGR